MTATTSGREMARGDANKCATLRPTACESAAIAAAARASGDMLVEAAAWDWCVLLLPDPEEGPAAAAAAAAGRL